MTPLQAVRVHGGPGGEGGESSANIIGKYFSQVTFHPAASSFILGKVSLHIIVICIAIKTFGSGGKICNCAPVSKVHCGLPYVWI